MQYMLDTNICIYIMKRQPMEVLKRLEVLRQGEVVMSVVTHAELRAGLEMQIVNRSHDDHVLGLLTRRIPVLSAYSTETGHSVHGKLDSRSVATRGLFFTPDLWV